MTKKTMTIAALAALITLAVPTVSAEDNDDNPGPTTQMPEATYCFLEEFFRASDEYTEWVMYCLENHSSDPEKCQYQ